MTERNYWYVRRFIAPQDQYRRWIDARVHRLRLSEVVSYLKSRGWKELPPDRPGFRAFQEPTGATLESRPVCVFVPTSELGDLPLRLFEVLTGLAEFENRQASEVIDDVLQHGGERETNGAAADRTQDAHPVL